MYTEAHLKEANAATLKERAEWVRIMSRSNVGERRHWQLLSYPISYYGGNLPKGWKAKEYEVDEVEELLRALRS